MACNFREKDERYAGVLPGTMYRATAGWQRESCGTFGSDDQLGYESFIDYLPQG